MCCNHCRGHYKSLPKCNQLVQWFFPLIAIQLQAVKIGDKISLVFTKVLDQMTLGMVDDDEDTTEPTDRDFWMKKATKETVSYTDELIKLIHTFDLNYEFKYNKHYIGLSFNGQAKTSARLDLIKNMCK